MTGLGGNSGYRGCGSIRLPRAISILTFVATLWLSLFVQANAHGVHAASKSAAMVLDANTGKVLYARNGDALRYPASLTKMMTLYMVFDELEAGRLTLKTPITMTTSAAKKPPSKLGLKPGRKILVKDAIRALITKSANDVAAAVAEHIAGSESAFARRMTRRARNIGMSSTTFKNASGLTHDGQRTTARDMITLALSLQDDHPQYFKLFGTKSFRYRGKTYRNHNTLLRSMRGVNGIKTGYTRASGFNLVTSMRHGRKHVVAAVFGGRTARARNARMRSLLYKAMRKASTRKTRRPRPMLLAKPKRAPRTARIAARSRPTPRASTVPAPVPRPRLQTAQAAPPATPGPRPFRPAGAKAEPIQPRVAMARVRPVSIIPPRANKRAAVVTTQRRPTVQRRALPELARAAPTTPPPRPFHQAGVTSYDRPLAARPIPIAARPVAARPRPVTQGRRPSTLNQQAAQLTGRRHFGAGLARMEGRWGLNGPRPRDVAAQRARSNGNYHIQVGAFPSAQQATHAAQRIRSQMPQVLNGYQVVTLPVNIRGKQLWRARFAGFVSSEATRTCNHMRRNNVDCFVARR